MKIRYKLLFLLKYQTRTIFSTFIDDHVIQQQLRENLKILKKIVSRVQLSFLKKFMRKKFVSYFKDM